MPGDYDTLYIGMYILKSQKQWMNQSLIVNSDKYYYH